MQQLFFLTKDKYDNRLGGLYVDLNARLINNGRYRFICLEIANGYYYVDAICPLTGRIKFGTYFNTRLSPLQMLHLINDKLSAIDYSLLKIGKNGKYNVSIPFEHNYNLNAQIDPEEAYVRIVYITRNNWQPQNFVKTKHGK